jgi:DNA-binding transcriptional LysR family regulator
MSMPYLHWDLDILARAVELPHLTSAAAIIGMSQPQLSRIVKKLESELEIPLLNRESKRSASWTPEARKVADLYRRTFLAFQIELSALQNTATQSYLRVGALDGLANHALNLCHSLLADASIQTVELDLYDLLDLESRFLAGNLDLIFTLREPDRSKSLLVRTLGYQRIEPHGVKGGILVKSVFEQNSPPHAGAEDKKRRPDRSKAFVSNSLAMRQQWITQFQGYGTLPSPIHARKSGKGLEYPALLIGRPGLAKVLWEKINELLKPAP